MPCDGGAKDRICAGENEDVSNEWLEPVDDEQYAKLDR